LFSPFGFTVESIKGVGGASTTQAKYFANQNDELCLSCGKDYLIFPPNCACAKQGNGNFAYYKKGLLKKVYID
jgi:hypothetical protein